MDNLQFLDTIKNAQSKIFILGTNPIATILNAKSTTKIFANLLNCHSSLTIEIFYESDTENFHQATNFSLSEKPTRLSSLETHKKRISGQSAYDNGLKGVIESLFTLDSEPDSSDNRLTIKQFNLRLPINIIQVDDELYICTTLSSLSTIDDYELIDSERPLYKRVQEYIETSVRSSRARDYLSENDDELIWVYDKNAYPRGVYPRDSFYTTDYGRYVVWVFVFNRSGKMLLQRRSMATKDNRGLWDKSIGGHVDLSDSSTSMTAKRELIEEIYMPDAEFTKYVKADIGDIIDFGELNFRKRPERHLQNELINLGKADWAMFRATSNKGKPLTIERVSERIINITDTNTVVKKTIFHADIYLMMAPKGQFESASQLEKEQPTGELSATTERKILSVAELNSWVQELEQRGEDKKLFTDDMLYINTVYSDLLDEFSEFVKYINVVEN